VGKQLVITEKPSVARDIVDAIGGFTDHGEFFESDTYLVTWAVGHLLELAPPEEYDKKYKAWTLATLPILPEHFEVRPKEGFDDRLKLIRDLGARKDVDGVIDACDAGREGEMIFRRIAEYTDLPLKNHKRLWLQSMTKQSILNGFEDLRNGGDFDHLGDAAWLRSVGDWLIGMNATRALTKRLKGRRERGVWSAGRVQTPTLRMLVEREREILAHEPRPYWEIQAQFAMGDQSWMGRYFDPNTPKGDRDVKPSRIFDKAWADAVMEANKDEGEAKEKRRLSKQKPPQLFDLTSLQREANRRFRFSAKRTLRAAQRLYEHYKLLTYPRTDSRCLPEDYVPTVEQTLEILTTDADYQKVAMRVQEQGLLNADKIFDNSRITDHFAIVPTPNTSDEALRADEARIYDLVVRQFLAAFMGPATWAVVERVVDVDVNGRKASFKTSTRSLEIPGFLEALGQDSHDGVNLPPLVPGQDKSEGVAVGAGPYELEEKQTKPPSRYSEAALLRLMETAGSMVEDGELSDAMKERGLGTPATRADIIERLIYAQYARRASGKLGASPKGMRLMDVLERANVPTISSPKLTGEWEYQLRQVQQGERSKAEQYDDVVRYTKDVVSSLVGFDHDTLWTPDGPLGECPACKQGQVIETAWGYRCTRNTGEDDGCKLMIWKDRGGRYVDRDLAIKLITDRKAGPLEGFYAFGKQMEGTIFLEEEDGKWQMRTEYGPPKDEDDGVPEVAGPPIWDCPEHENCKIIETNKRWICQKMLEGEIRQGPMLPRVVCKREMQPEEVAAYFTETARTETMENFISRRGRPFRGLLFRKPTGRHGFEFPPRKKKAGSKKKTKKKATKKNSATKKKTTAKKSTTKKSTTKKATTKKATTKKAATKKKTAAKKKPAAKKTAKKTEASEAKATGVSKKRRSSAAKRLVSRMQSKE